MISALRSFNPSRNLSHPFLSLCCLELTRRTVIFWSMKSNTVLMRAGKKAAQRAHTGRVMNGTSHGRPTVVVSAVGTVSVGRARAYLSGGGGRRVSRQYRSKRAKSKSTRLHTPETSIESRFSSTNLFLQQQPRRRLASKALPSCTFQISSSLASALTPGHLCDMNTCEISNYITCSCPRGQRGFPWPRRGWARSRR